MTTDPHLGAVARPEAGSDAAVIRASLRDPHLFAAIFDRHFDAIHRYAQRRVGADSADEVTSETFARAFDQRRRFDVRVGDARPWLLGIASNILRRHWRAERRRLAAYARLDVAEAATDAAKAPLEELIGALDELSAKEREVLFLYAIADLSYDEIAVALELPVGTVRSRLARARADLRASLRAPRSSDSAPNPHEIEESSHA